MRTVNQNIMGDPHCSPVELQPQTSVQWEIFCRLGLWLGGGHGSVIHEPPLPQGRPGLLHSLLMRGVSPH